MAENRRELMDVELEAINGGVYDYEPYVNADNESGYKMTNTHFPGEWFCPTENVFLVVSYCNDHSTTAEIESNIQHLLEIGWIKQMN